MILNSQLVHELRGHDSMVNSVKFNPLDGTLVSADSKGRLIRWCQNETMASSYSSGEGKQSKESNWILDKNMHPAGLEDKAITCTEMHPSAQLLLIQARNSCLHMLDLRR